MAGESPQSNNDSVTGCVETSTDRKKDTAAPMPDNQILQLQLHTSVPIKMSTMQAQVHEAGLKAAAEARGQEAPKDSPAVDKALDPSSDFPEKPLEPTKAEGEGMQVKSATVRGVSVAILLLQMLASMARCSCMQSHLRNQTCACGGPHITMVYALQNVDQMAVRAPVAGKKGQGDLKGDVVGGINR